MSRYDFEHYRTPLDEISCSKICQNFRELMVYCIALSTIFQVLEIGSLTIPLG